MIKILKSITFLLLLAASLTATAIKEGGTIEDIQITNVKQINTDLIFANLSIRVGDTFTGKLVADAVKELYRTGYFDNIKALRKGNILIFEITERPTIRDITIEGNDTKFNDRLYEILTLNNISKGEVLRRNALDKIVSEFEQYYGSIGQYGTVIDVEVEEKNLLANLNINVNEAGSITVSSINIIGNNAFTDDELIEQFELNENDFWTRAFSWAYDANEYAQEKLQGDIERLRDYYFERGYIDFSIISTDVTLSNNYDNIYITINVNEGKQYRIGAVTFNGELIGKLEDYTSKVAFNSGDVYLESLATETKLAIKTMLEDLGYGFAEVDLQFKPDRPTRTVDLSYIVRPGKIVYIHKILFEGNKSTTETALRQELRIFEGGWFSNSKIIESENRLRRLGFFSQVSHNIVPVPGKPNMVDVVFKLESVPTGSFQASASYSNLLGVGFGLTLAEKNIAGTGNSGNINIQTSERVNQASINWNKPYINHDGANLNTGVSYYRVNYKGSEIANFVSSSLGFHFSLGYPIGEHWRFNYGASFTQRSLTLGNDPILEVQNFVDEYNKKVNVPALELSLGYNSYNTGFLTTEGLKQNITFFSTPGTDDLHFYRLGYSLSYYQPIDTYNKWVYRPSMRLGYGKTYNNNDTYPFIYHYYAGGYGTVRGYGAGSLGPRATDSDGKAGAIGGNILVQSSHELVIPTWFHTERTRYSLFYDIGNVFTDKCLLENVSWCEEGVQTGELRSSAGLSIEWHTLIGPLVFILPKAIDPQDGDITNTFEFSLGRVF